MTLAVAAPPTRLWPTFVIGTTHVLVAAAILPLVPLHAVARGASPEIVGVVAASTAILPLAFGVWTGAGIDTVGIRRMSVAGAVLMAASISLIAWAPVLTVLIMGTALAGLASNMLVLATQTSVAHAVQSDDRDRVFGFYAFWASAGQLVGPFAGGWLAQTASTEMALWVAAAGALIPCALAPWLDGVRAPTPGDATAVPALRAPDVYGAAWAVARRQHVRFILTVAFAILFAWSIKSSFFPLYLHSVGLPKSSIGLVFSCMGGGAMLVRPLIGAATLRFGRRRLLIAAVATAALGLGVTPMLRELWLLAAAATAAGMAWGITQPLTVSLMVGGVDAHERGLALSVRMTVNRLAEMISPMIFGALVARSGLGSAFYLSAAALALILAAIVRAPRRDLG